MARLTPICVPCKQSMRCEQNDYPVKDKATDLAPATVWLGDKFKCPDCDYEVVVGFGKGRPSPGLDPLTVSYALEFKR